MATTQPDISNVLFRKNELLRQTRIIRILLRIAAATLVLLFGWLKLSGLDIAPITRQVTADLVLQFALAVYYLCWVTGLLSDIGDQELAYAEPPDARHVLMGGLLAFVLIAGLFAYLCLVDTYQEFAGFLAAFLLVNVGAWLYLIHWVVKRPAYRSEHYFRAAQSYAELEQVRLVYRGYLCGNWQWTRFLVGAIVVAFINVLAFTDLAEALSRRFGTPSPDLLISLAVLLFVLVMELWIWIVRMRMKMGLRLLDQLRARYRFTLEGR